MRVSQELALVGITISVGGVRGVWGRHDLLSKHARLLRLERKQREKPVELSEQQIRLLERFSPEFRERQIEVHHSGELVAIDTFFVEALKGDGKVYLQTVIDCFSHFAFGRLYTSKMPLTAVHVLNNDVLPFFDQQGAGLNPFSLTMAADIAEGRIVIPLNCSYNRGRDRAPHHAGPPPSEQRFCRTAASDTPG